MKFIPILIVVLLCCAGTEHISATDYSCFSSTCHTNGVHSKTITNHVTTSYASCTSADCHSIICYGLYVQNIESGEVESETIKAKTIAEMEEEKKSDTPSFGPDSETQKITLFTEDDSDTIMGILVDSGAGLIFAAVDMLFKVSLWVVPLLIFIGIVVYSFLNKAEENRNLIKGILLIIVIVIFVKMYFSFIMNITPDLSTIEF